jgi:hypothetical protein
MVGGVSKTHALKARCVYYFVDRGTTSTEPHYFVVVNKDPIGSKILILTIITSNIERVRRIEGKNLNFAIAVGAVNAALYSLITEQESQQRGPLAPPAAVPTPIERQVPTTRSQPDLKEFVRNFVTSGNYDDPAVESSFYAEEVDYFDDGKVGKAFVVNDIKNYNQRWPTRSYWVDGDPTVRIVDSVRDVAKAIVVLRFSVQNGRKTVGGSCQNTILIRDASANPKVISVKSKFLSRYEKPPCCSWRRCLLIFDGRWTSISLQMIA